MFIQKFKYKLISHLQNWFNSEIEFLKIIFAFAKCCLTIYKQIQVINQIRNKVNSFIIIQITANILLKAITSSSQVFTVSNKNISFLHLFNTL